VFFRGMIGNIDDAAKKLAEAVESAGHSDNEVAKLRGLIERIGEASDALQLAVITGSIEALDLYIKRERIAVIEARKEAQKDAGPVVAIPRDLAEMLESVIAAEVRHEELLCVDDTAGTDQAFEDANGERDAALTNLVTVHRRWKGETENCCEHGDHRAPQGQRFCSDACARCENYSTGDEGCDGICQREEQAP
jgi:hypothetical protein